MTSPPILVVGGCGGAGATTTALGLAGAAAAGDIDCPTVAVDATAAGGDLAIRGADVYLAPTPLQPWLAAAETRSGPTIDTILSRASSGARLLWRDENPLQRRTTFATAARLITGAGYTPVFDGGSPPSAPHLRSLLQDNTIRVVLAISARVDAANRMRANLQWLDDHLGQEAIAATTLVVSHQLPDAPLVAAQLREHLGRWVREVAEIPYDRHLAAGLSITHAELSPQTRHAYAQLLEGIWA
ncbi:hypothetical protein ACIBG0_36875 [Nocardia sp. NPDC050630]|uniref:hypothetical protein n=1 Tax=Nocardia sp. NPDC050630 TaxID=3364321 RepID=UPI003796B44F